MKKTVLALTSILSSVLGFSDAKAITVAHDLAAGNSPNNLTVKQQKAIFAFSRDCASFTTALMERWSGLSAEERYTETKLFLETFFDALKNHPDADAVRTELGSSLLMADALGNAKYLLDEGGTLSTAALDEAIEGIKSSLMRVCVDTNSEIIVPYIPTKVLWGQHGQHFVRRPPRRTRVFRGRRW